MAEHSGGTTLRSAFIKARNMIADSRMSILFGFEIINLRTYDD